MGVQKREITVLLFVCMMMLVLLFKQPLVITRYIHTILYCDTGKGEKWEEGRGKTRQVNAGKRKHKISK